MSNIRIFEHKDGENILVKVEEKVAAATAVDPSATEELVALSIAAAADEE